MVRVALETSERPPPMTPAIAWARRASAITSMSGSSARSMPSSVVIRSPGSALRMRSSLPASNARSKACIGWPSSIST
jgi:hypothetical protein